jgi:hypothetical protein
MTRDRLIQAMVCYAVLAALGAWMLEGDIRLAVWIFLAALAVKSYVAFLKEKQSP